MANLAGTIGADAIVGTVGADAISGLAGDDTLDGRGGNDRIQGGDGLDTIIGGAGDDYVVGGRDDDRVNGGDGNDVLQGNDGNDLLLGDAGNDRLYGGDGNDDLDGGDGNDWLSGGGGGDRLTAGGLDLFANPIGGLDLLHGGGGRDLFQILHDGSRDLIGTQQSIVMDFQAADDILLVGGSGATPDASGYTVKFSDIDSNHNGVLESGDQFVDVRQVTADGAAKLSTVIDVAGLRGDQPQTETLTVHGVTGLMAEAFDDRRFLGDTIDGTGGGDRLTGAAANDTLDGGGGNDRLYGQGGNDTLLGGDGNDLLVGGSGDDSMVGGNGADRLFGGTGQDILMGDRGAFDNGPLIGSSDDFLSGGAGNDALFGSFGHDVLEGGAGRDSFGIIGVGDVLDDGSKPAVDVLVTDFEHGEDVLNDQTVSFDQYDKNGDGLIKGSDPYVTLKQVTYGDETKISLVINLHDADAAVATGKLTLFGVTGLDQSDFTSAS